MLAPTFEGGGRYKGVQCAGGSASCSGLVVGRPKRSARSRAGGSVGWHIILGYRSTLSLLCCELAGNGSRPTPLQVMGWSKVRQLLRSPSNLLIICQGLPGCLPWGMLLTFMNDYLAQVRAPLATASGSDVDSSRP